METKGLLFSKTIWGSIITLIPAASEAVNQVLGSGVLPPQAVLILTGVGGLLTLLGRLTAKTEIKGIV